MVRAADGSVATTEQDTPDDVVSRVTAVAYLHRGELDGQPDLGHAEWAFMEQPIGADAIAAEILRSDPGAQILVEEAPDRFDALVDHIGIIVNAPRSE